MPDDGRQERDQLLLEAVASELDRQALEAERRRELIRAWLAGYWTAINEARAIVDLPPLPLPTARPGTDSRQAGSGT